MTVLGNRATHAPRTGVGSGAYVLVGLVALIVGLLVGLGLREITTSSTAATAVTERSTEVTANLAGLWESGVVQQQAMKERGLVIRQIEAGTAQAAAMRERGLLQARVEAGIVQSGAITRQQATLKGRIEAGIAQSEAMTATSGFHDAWSMRGRLALDALDTLMASGRAQAAALIDA